MANGVVRFDPFEDMNRLQKEMNRLFDDSYRAPNRSPEGVSSRAWQPPVDVKEDANEITLHVDLPGIKQDDIDIELTGDTLTIKGERKLEDKEQTKNFVRVERVYGTFQRSFSLSAPIKSDQVSASFHDGVLTVRVPKSDETKPKKVLVSAG